MCPKGVRRVNDTTFLAYMWENGQFLPQGVRGLAFICHIFSIKTPQAFISNLAWQTQRLVDSYSLFELSVYKQVALNIFETYNSITTIPQINACSRGLFTTPP